MPEQEGSWGGQEGLSAPRHLTPGLGLTVGLLSAGDLRKTLPLGGRRPPWAVMERNLGSPRVDHLTHPAPPFPLNLPEPPPPPLSSLHLGLLSSPAPPLQSGQVSTSGVRGGGWGSPGCRKEVKPWLFHCSSVPMNSALGASLLTAPRWAPSSGRMMQGSFENM